MRWQWGVAALAGLALLVGIGLVLSGPAPEPSRPTPDREPTSGVSPLTGTEAEPGPGKGEDLSSLPFRETTPADLETATPEEALAGGAFGVVLTPEGAPVEGAMVHLILDMSALREIAQEGATIGTIQTKRDGRFRLGGLQSGDTYILVATHPAYAAAVRHPIDPADRKSLHQELRLQPGAELSGRVTDVNGTGILRARVRVYDLGLQSFDPDPRTERIVFSDEGGGYSVSALTPGVKKVLVDKDGFASDGRLGVDVRVGNPGKVDFQLDSGLTLEGMVVETKSGLPVPGAQVIARPQPGVAPNGVSHEPLVPSAAGEGGAVRSSELVRVDGVKSDILAQEKFFLTAVTRTDERGSFRLEGLLPTPYLLQVRAPGFLQAAHISLDAGTSGHRLTIARTARLSGTVVDDETGQPLRVFSIAASQNESLAWIGPLARQRFSDDQGRFTYVDAPPGRHWLVAEAEGYAGGRSTEPVQVTVDQDLSGLVVRMQRGSTLRGRILGADGQPLPGARVELVISVGGGLPENPLTRGLMDRLRPSVGKEGATDVRGEYHLENVAQGSYRVRARHAASTDSTTEEFACDGRGELRVPELRMALAGRVVGVVRKPDGTPDAAATVMLQARSGGSVGGRTGATDAAGRFEIGGLKSGTYQLVLTMRDGKPNPFAMLLGDQGAPILVTVEEGRVTEKDL